MGTVSIGIDLLRVDGATQPRSIINSNVVDEYAADMRGGDTFPPVDAFYDGSNYWLVDGFQRREAALIVGLAALDVVVHQGTQREAQWFSFSVNRAHGSRRSNHDKQRAVEAALKHPKSKGLSDREIARHVGVSTPTVSKFRESICKTFTDTNPTTRTATRNGTTYEINIENIGTRGQQLSQSMPPRHAGSEENGPDETGVDNSQALRLMYAVRQVADCQLTTEEVADFLAEEGATLDAITRAYEFLNAVINKATAPSADAE